MHSCLEYGKSFFAKVLHANVVRVFGWELYQKNIAEIRKTALASNAEEI